MFIILADACCCEVKEPRKWGILICKYERHGNGLGNKLFEKLLGVAKIKGASKLHVPSSRNAIGFYEKMGFKTDAQQTDLDDEITIYVFRSYTPKSVVNPILQSAVIGIDVLYMVNLFNHILFLGAIDTYMFEVLLSGKVSVVSRRIGTKH